MGVFGWSLPPGVTNQMIDEAVGGDMPVECEDCELYDDDLGTCPYMDNIDFCFKIALVKSCANCEKILLKVRGLFNNEEIASGFETMYCCSESCAKSLQAKIDEEIQEMNDYNPFQKSDSEEEQNDE